jgi:hypothetical protein
VILPFGLASSVQKNLLPRLLVDYLQLALQYAVAYQQ